jgi:hypothetical protein
MNRRLTTYLKGIEAVVTPSDAIWQREIKPHTELGITYKTVTEEKEV